MSELPSVTEVSARALALLRDRNRGAELDELVVARLPAAVSARLAGRPLEVRGEGTRVVVSGPELGPARLVLELAPDGAWLAVELDMAGRRPPEALAHLPLRLVYAAGSLPTEHRFWSDAGGLLMVGELAASSGC